ncbi:MAG: hypothetical protein RLZZ568_2061 [Cyanobacteriota bacterium]|jgi:hypothetical protein
MTAPRARHPLGLEALRYKGYRVRPSKHITALSTVKALGKHNVALRLGGYEPEYLIAD